MIVIFFADEKLNMLSISLSMNAKIIRVLNTSTELQRKNGISDSCILVSLCIKRCCEILGAKCSLKYGYITWENSYDVKIPHMWIEIDDETNIIIDNTYFDDIDDEELRDGIQYVEKFDDALEDTWNEYHISCIAEFRKFTAEPDKFIGSLKMKGKEHLCKYYVYMLKFADRLTTLPMITASNHIYITDI